MAGLVTALGISAVVLLILANGYFVAAEFGYVAARRTVLEERAREGDRRAARALEVQRRLSFMLSGAQLGITVTSLLVGFIAEPTLGRALEPLIGAFGVGEEARLGIALAVAFVVATAAQMVLGELAPKNMAIARPEGFSRRLSGTILVFLRVAGPVIHFFDSSANRLLRLVGIEPVEELPPGVTVDELDFVVEESVAKGSLSRDQARLVARAVRFRTLTAAEVMTPRTQMVTISADADGAELLRVSAGGHSRFPVTEGEANPDAVVGIVGVADLLSVAPEDRSAVPVRSLMRPVVAVPSGLRLEPVLAELRRAHSQMALVVDEYGGTDGIVTLEDLVEELVGEIADEHDVEAEAGPVRLGALSWSVPGWWRVDELERDIGVRLPPGDYDTVGGYLMAALGRIPMAGDTVEIEGARITTAATESHAVTRVVVTVVGADDQ